MSIGVISDYIGCPDASCREETLKTSTYTGQFGWTSIFVLSKYILHLWSMLQCVSKNRTSMIGMT